MDKKCHDVLCWQTRVTPQWKKIPVSINSHQSCLSTFLMNNDIQLNQHYENESFERFKLKADWSHQRDYQHTPTDYRHTDKHLWLVMTLIALCCTRQIPNIARNLTLTRPLTLTLTPTLKQGNSNWPTIPSQPSSRSTYIPNFKAVGQAVLLWEWRRTDRQYQIHYLTASRSIIRNTMSTGHNSVYTRQQFT